MRSKNENPSDADLTVPLEVSPEARQRLDALFPSTTQADIPSEGVTFENGRTRFKRAVDAVLYGDGIKVRFSKKGVRRFAEIGYRISF